MVSICLQLEHATASSAPEHVGDHVIALPVLIFDCSKRNVRTHNIKSALADNLLKLTTKIGILARRRNIQALREAIATRALAHVLLAQAGTAMRITCVTGSGMGKPSSRIPSI